MSAGTWSQMPSSDAKIPRTAARVGDTGDAGSMLDGTPEPRGSRMGRVTRETSGSERVYKILRASV